MAWVMRVPKKFSAATASGDFIQILRSGLAERQLRNPSYSLRAYAKLIGLQPSTLSELMSGKRMITNSLAQRVLDRMGVSPQRASDMISSLPESAPRGRPRKPTMQRASIQQESKSKAPLLHYIQLSADEFNIVADWYYFAILSLAETERFESSPEWISRRLGINLTQAKSAVETLIRMGLLKTGPRGSLKASGKKFQAASTLPSSSIRKNHLQGLQLAEQALHDVSLEKREFGAATIIIDPELLPVAKEKIRAFRSEMTALMESGKKKEVYRLNVQFFPLTKEIL